MLNVSSHWCYVSSAVFNLAHMKGPEYILYFVGGKLGKIKLRRQLGKVSVLGRSLFRSLPLTSPRERSGRTRKQLIIRLVNATVSSNPRSRGGDRSGGAWGQLSSPCSEFKKWPFVNTKQDDHDIAAVRSGKITLTLPYTARTQSLRWERALSLWRHQ